MMVPPSEGRPKADRLSGDPRRITHLAIRECCNLTTVPTSWNRQIVASRAAVELGEATREQLAVPIDDVIMRGDGAQLK
jgi:hypothetical protein